MQQDMNTQPQPRKRQRLLPARLAEKLKRIRMESGLTQTEMLGIINPNETGGNNRARVSQYESHLRAPSLVEVCNYATHQNVPLDLPPATFSEF